MEKWIQSFALRNTMLRAHRQAWAWQDEWFGLTITEIRQLEAEVLFFNFLANKSTPFKLHRFFILS